MSDEMPWVLWIIVYLVVLFVVSFILGWSMGAGRWPWEPK